MIPVRLQQASEAAHDHISREVVQQPLETGAICLELREDGCKVDELYLSDDMLEVFINLEACYRQQGMSDSTVRAFRQLSHSGKSGL